MKNRTLYWIQRVKTWAHDTLVLLGVLVVFLALGGAQICGYYMDLAFVPLRLIEQVETKKK